MNRKGTKRSLTYIVSNLVGEKPLSVRFLLKKTTCALGILKKITILDKLTNFS
jgi:hypothetical protein